MQKQRWEESEKRRGRREDQRRERVRRKKMQVRERVEKSRNTVFLQWFVAPAGRKVGSLKRRVRSHLARWEMKNCTPLWHKAHLQVKKLKHLTFGALLEVAMSKKCRPLWREAHFQVKMYKADTPFSDHFWKLRCWKSARRCGAKPFRSQHVQNTLRSEHSWKLRCSKSVRRCGAKHISKSKCTKHHMSAPLLDVEALFCVASARGSPPCQKWEKRDTWRGLRDLQRWISRGRRSTRDMSGRWFPKKGCILEHQIFRFAKMILQQFVWVGITFSWQAQYFRQMESKNRKTH